MIDFDKPVQTRDGRKVRVLCTDMENRSDRVCGVVTAPDGVEYPQTWYIDGRLGNGVNSNTDLINVSETKVVWVNLAEHDTPRVFQNLNSANLNANSDRHACIRVEYTVGQFDEEGE